jgi:tetratricopeptide (TPR) repeat protein
VATGNQSDQRDMNNSEPCMGDQIASLRAAGNEKFRASRYRDALVDYDDALAVAAARRSDEGLEVIHANRSAALHALGELEQALTAGLDATTLRPDYAKGHLRVANGAQSPRASPLLRILLLNAHASHSI